MYMRIYHLVSDKPKTRLRAVSTPMILHLSWMKSPSYAPMEWTIETSLYALTALQISLGRRCMFSRLSTCIARWYRWKNTNVIEMCNLVLKEVEHNQRTWYNSGIGTYAQPSWKSLRFFRQVISHKIDLVIAWWVGGDIFFLYFSSQLFQEFWAHNFSCLPVAVGQLWTWWLYIFVWCVGAAIPTLTGYWEVSRVFLWRISGLRSLGNDRQGEGLAFHLFRYLK